MKLVKLVNGTVAEVTARLTKPNRSGRRFYKITHGSFAHGLHAWILPLAQAIFGKQDDGVEGSEKVLTEDSYVLQPIIVKDKHITDINGQKKYRITRDNLLDHKKDVLLFWEIPNNYYTHVKYNISGSCAKIAEGKSGRNRNGKQYTSPFPVIEIMGDCTLTWSAKDTINNREISQTISYKYNTEDFDISPIYEKN